MFRNVILSFFAICGVVSLHCTVLFGQQSIWENVLPLEKWNMDTESPTNDLPAFKLYVEVKNAIGELEIEARSNGQEFLTPSEQVAVAAINEVFATPQFHAAVAASQGKQVDYDKMFAEMNSNAPSLFIEAKVILGSKFDRVIERVNRLSIAGNGALDPTGSSHAEFGRILGITEAQSEKIAVLVQKFREEGATIDEEFANRVRQIRAKSRSQITASMNADARKKFERIFGAPMDLIDSDGESFFVDIVKAYNKLPPSESVETIQTIVKKASPEKTDARLQFPLANTVGANEAAVHIKLDQLELLLIRSGSVISELELTDGQFAALERKLTGPNVVVELTTTDRDERAVRLLDEIPLDESVISSVMNAKQRSRFAQIELQVRTIEHIDSFGILDPVVPMNLGLTKAVCNEIDKLAKVSKQEILQLIADKQRSGQARIAKLTDDLENVLTSDQVAIYRKFLGTRNTQGD